jgi:integrase
MSMRLTDAVANRATLPRGKSDIVLWDAAETGFGLRLRKTTKGVSRNWLIQYRDDLGKNCRYTLGDLAHVNTSRARAMARDKLHGVRHGVMPHLERAERAKEAEQQLALERQTFGALSVQFLAKQQEELRPRSFTEVTRYITKHWAPLHKVPIHNITLANIAARLDEISQTNGKMAANQARAKLSSFFQWAMKRGIVTANPVALTDEHKEVPRDRKLSIDELVAVWSACEDDDHGRITRLLVLTGARLREIGGMRWSEFNLELGKWTLPKERAKNGSENCLTLPPAALALVPARGTRDLLFGQGANGFNNYPQAKARLDARIEAMTGKRLAAWRAHDLRHSFSTHLHELGVEPWIVEQIMNHKGGHKAGDAGRYNGARYEAQIKEALAMWVLRLTAAVNGLDPKVVPLRAKRRTV